MGKGHIQSPKLVACATCNVVFMGLHYSSKYCSEHCKKHNRQAKQKLRRQNYGYALRNLYGVSLEQYEKLLEKQNHVCAICKKPSKKRLSVDHCHETLQIRGLLCHNCNTGLGHFKDNIERLQTAIEYLKFSKQELKKVKGL